MLKQTMLTELARWGIIFGRDAGSFCTINTQ